MMPTLPTVRQLIFTLLVLMFFSVTANASIYLLSVGVSDYPGTRNDLALPTKDAATMQRVYRENKRAKVCLLTDSHATVAAVKKALQRMVSLASADDIVVLFFSGHGVKGGFVCYDGYLYYSDIYRSMAKCKSKNKMIFADACYAGAMRRGNSRPGRGSNLTGSNVMLFLACRDNEMSMELSTMKNGYFTHALQNGLRGSADANHDRVITARELFDYVSDKVKIDTHNRQHPVMWGKFPANMPVMKW